MNIKQLTIYSTQVQAQARFYNTVLGVKILQQAPHQITLDLGNSLLKIAYSPNATPYHFAINIPANKANEALIWLKARLPVLKYKTQELQDFYNWNAEAMYFYDEDKNIVELIARKNLNNSTSNRFDASSFLELSEIGLPVTDIEATFQQLHHTTGIEIFDGAFQRFCAIGDEHGLFICINRTDKKWFPVDDLAWPSDFNIEFIQNGNHYQLEFNNEQLLF